MRQEPVIALRKSPTRDPEEFVTGPKQDRPQLPAIGPMSGEEGAPSVELHPRRRRVLARQDGRALHRTTIYVPTEMTRRLAVFCAERGVTLSEVVNEALSRHLGT